MSLRFNYCNDHYGNVGYDNGYSENERMCGV